MIFKIQKFEIIYPYTTIKKNHIFQILGERGLPGLPGAPGQQGIRGMRGLRGETGFVGKQGKNNIVEAL